MRRHHTGQRGAQPGVRRGVLGKNGFEAAPVYRYFGMGIGLGKSVAWKVFAAVGHAALQHSVHQAFGQQAHHRRVARKSAVPDHTAGSMVKIEHRRKRQIHTAGA